MSNLKDAANKTLTDSLPDAPSSAHGLDSVPSPTDAPIVVPGESWPAAADATAPAAASPTLRFCPTCAAVVEPVGRGSCPSCGRFLVANTVRRRFHVDQARRDELHERIIEQFKPATFDARMACQQLASTYERLDTERPGSPEWQRLIAGAQSLTVQLRDSQSFETQPDVENIDPAALVLQLERMLDTARRVRDASRPDTPQLASISEVKNVETTAIQPESTQPAPEPAPSCPHCYHTPQECEALKANNLETWLVIHAAAEEAIDIRKQQAQQRDENTRRLWKLAGITPPRYD